MGSKVNLTGKVFGKLTVIKEIGRSNFGKVEWECLCECGKTKHCIGSNLINGRSKSCGSCIKIPDLVGKKFGILTVIEYLGLFDTSDSNHKIAMWLCEDNIGLKKKMTTAQLIAGKNIHVNRVYTREIAALIGIYNKYKNHCQKVNREFNVDKKLFLELIQENCYYCGSSPMNTAWDKGRTFSVKYNGLDRVDSSKGYIKENIVTCCSNCNFAKQDFDLSEFYVWINKVYTNLKNRGVL